MGAINLSDLSNATTSAGALSNLILIDPQKVIGIQPQKDTSGLGAVFDVLTGGPPKFLFHYEGENTISLTSDITDHYVEDNTAIQDQSALSPEKVKVSGFIGELNDVVPEAVAFLKTIAEKLTVLSPYEPELTADALRAYNAAFQAYNAAKAVVNSAVASWASITGTGGGVTITGSESQAELALLGRDKVSQTKQQVAFQQFYGYWRQRTLFTVQTPWAIFKNMAIESLTAVQDPDTDKITNFEIEFKIMRFAQSLLDGGGLVSGRLSEQASAVVDLGTSTPAQSLDLIGALA